MVTQTIDINLVPGISAPVCHVSQYDVGREITFNLYNGTEAYTPTAGAVIVCNGTKSNGTGFASSTTWSGNVVTVATDAQMTDMAGISYCELVITVGDVRVGTANFLMKVEQAGVSEDTEFDSAQIAYVADALATLGSTESIYNTLNARIDNIVAPSGDPTLTEVADARYSALTEETYASLTTRILSDDEYVDGKIGALASLETEDKTSIVAAINELLASQNSGLTDAIKVALLNCFQNVAWINDNGQTYYDALYNALYEVTAIVLNTYSIAMAEIGSTTQLTATTTPEGAAVTWASSNTSVATVDSTGLVTSVAYGNATITATAGSITASCAVTVAQATVISISATYTQSGTVYTTDSLDSLKSDLVVTATWSNGTTSTVVSTDYTLSGTLTEGTSTITVSYGGMTATFNVTVTAAIWRTARLSDVESSVGITGLSVDENGTFSQTSAVTFSVLDFVDTITSVRGYVFGTQSGPWLVFNKYNSTDFYATDGTNVFTFVKSGNLYNATKVTGVTSITVTGTYDENELRNNLSEIVLENNVLTLTNANSDYSISVTNANTIGLWWSNTRTGVPSYVEVK